jgi:hypothetical protein
MAFEVNETGTTITMHAGDTGAFKVKATRSSGTDWTEDDRMLFTIRNGSGEIVLQRFYRLDDDDGLGNGVVEIQFHNNDTDEWAPGSYTIERRYAVNPYWDGTAPEGMCVNALTAGVRMIEGDVVRTVVQGTLTILGILGQI